MYREIHADDEVVRVGNLAYWSHTEDNPALRRFLSFLRERYPQEIAVLRPTD